MKISPRYQMDLEIKVVEKLFEFYKSYTNVESYLKKWHFVSWEDINGSDENFHFSKSIENKLNVPETVASIDGETLLKIAIDLGIETPDFLPSIPVFRNIVKSEYVNAHASFEKAFKDIEEHPDIAIGLANSALESIIKEILKDEVFTIEVKEKDTLFDLTQKILKEFKMYPSSELPMEIRTIGSSFLSINQSIEKLRSSKTKFHGGTTEDYVINDPMYAYFIVNSVITMGLFLDSFYKKNFKKVIDDDPLTILDEDDLPF